MNPTNTNIAADARMELITIMDRNTLPRGKVVASASVGPLGSYVSVTSSVGPVCKITVLPSERIINVYIRGTGYTIIPDGRIRVFTSSTGL